MATQAPEKPALRRVPILITPLQNPLIFFVAPNESEFLRFRQNPSFLLRSLVFALFYIAMRHNDWLASLSVKENLRQFPIHDGKTPTHDFYTIRDLQINPDF